MSLRHALALTVFALAPLSLCVSGCSLDLGSSTTGEEGHVAFAYSDSCFFGCAVDKPILVGAKARISITGAELPEIDARSEDETVLTVTTDKSYTCCVTSGSSTSCASSSKTAVCAEGHTKSVSQTLVVTTHADGSTRVVLVDAAGHRVDALRLEVRKPSTVTLRIVDEGGSHDVSELVMKTADVASIDPLVRDLDGRELHAPNGISLGISDPSVASFQDPSFIFANPNGLATIERGGFGTAPKLRAKSVGTATLRVITKGSETKFPVTVK